MLSVLKIHSLQQSWVVIKKAMEYIHHKHCKMPLPLMCVIDKLVLMHGISHKTILVFTQMLICWQLQQHLCKTRSVTPTTLVKAGTPQNVCTPASEDAKLQLCSKHSGHSHGAIISKNWEYPNRVSSGYYLRISWSHTILLVECTSDSRRSSSTPIAHATMKCSWYNIWNIAPFEGSKYNKNQKSQDVCCTTSSIKFLTRNYS